MPGRVRPTSFSGEGCDCDKLAAMNSTFAPLISLYESRLHALGVSQRLGLVADVAPVPLGWSQASRADVAIDVLRLDQLHPVISGNKWFKLKYNLLHAIEHRCERLASCGGAHSNHLHALAWAGQQLGLQTWAAVRGEELTASASPTLCDVQQWGMALEFVSREAYRSLRAQGGVFFDEASTHNIPEGGDNFLGMLGCVSLAAYCQSSAYDEIHLACGTGCTFLGLRLGLPDCVSLVGHSALKGEWQHAEMQRRLSQWGDGRVHGPWRMWSEPSRRFGRQTRWLAVFMQTFFAETGLALDPVYTGPMMWRLSQQLAGGEIPAGRRLLVIHSGGLQGLRAQAAMAG